MLSAPGKSADGHAAFLAAPTDTSVPLNAITENDYQSSMLELFSRYAKDYMVERSSSSSTQPQLQECQHVNQTHGIAADGSGPKAVAAGVKLPNDSTTSSFFGGSYSIAQKRHGVPSRLIQEYVAIMERRGAIPDEDHHTTAAAASPSPTPRRLYELEAENMYLRVVLNHMEEHLLKLETTKDLQQRSSPRRSPSAISPEPHMQPSATQVAAALHRTSDGRGFSPASTQEVGDLQEQIDVLRDAVLELSCRTSVVRAASTSPLPAEGSRLAVPTRAISPSPRCATPTCTTDVPTLQRIILQQQQTIRALEQEREDTLAQQTATHSELGLKLWGLSTTASKGNDEDGEVPGCEAMANWRSTCASGVDASDEPGAASAVKTRHTNPGWTSAAAPNMAERAVEFRFSSPDAMHRRPLFGSTVLDDVLDPSRTTGGGDGEGSSSGTQTPPPRRTVVLFPRGHRCSSLLEEDETAHPVDDGTPVMRPTQQIAGAKSPF